jgi:hypothetical protein
MSTYSTYYKYVHKLHWKGGGIKLIEIDRNMAAIIVPLMVLALIIPVAAAGSYIQSDGPPGQVQAAGCFISDTVWNRFGQIAILDSTCFISATGTADASFTGNGFFWDQTNGLMASMMFDDMVGYQVRANGDLIYLQGTATVIMGYTPGQYLVEVGLVDWGGTGSDNRVDITIDLDSTGTLGTAGDYYGHGTLYTGDIVFLDLPY